jgi:hypothetical protein
MAWIRNLWFNDDFFRTFIFILIGFGIWLRKLMLSVLVDIESF